MYPNVPPPAIVFFFVNHRDKKKAPPFFFLVMRTNALLLLYSTLVACLFSTLVKADCSDASCCFDIYLEGNVTQSFCNVTPEPCTPCNNGTDGAPGPAGATGATGPAGANGTCTAPCRDGNNGTCTSPCVNGTNGINAAGAEWQYSSGLPFTLVAILGGATQQSAIIGQESSNDGILVTVATPVINLALYNNVGPITSLGGNITSIAGFFTVTVSGSLLGSTNIRATLWSSATPNNIFAPVPGVTVALSPALTTLNIGTIVYGGIHGLQVPYSRYTRFILVFSVDGGGLAATVTGIGSAGVGYATIASS
jgi:BclB C-terminal domain-containing protein